MIVGCALDGLSERGSSPLLARRRGQPRASTNLPLMRFNNTPAVQASIKRLHR
jgi:hypothetical protein